MASTMNIYAFCFFKPFACLYFDRYNNLDLLNNVDLFISYEDRYNNVDLFHKL